MSGSVPDRDDGLLWDVTTPRTLRTPGVVMAGFRDRGITPDGIRLIPHPSVTLLLVCGGSIALETGSGPRRRGSFVLGMGFGDRMRARLVDGLECLQVRLSPVTAHAILGGAVGESGASGGSGASRASGDTILALDDLVGAEAARLEERLGALTSWPERFALADAWLSARATREVEPEVSYAWTTIVAARGTARIESLAKELGWSRKRLWSRFAARFGLPPKRAVRLVRFDHAVHRLVAGQDPAGVAADSGFVDQSHLHRDVAAFTSLTPATVIDEPFLGVDHVAWGWPSRSTRGRSSEVRSNRDHHSACGRSGAPSRREGPRSE